MEIATDGKQSQQNNCTCMKQLLRVASPVMKLLNATQAAKIVGCHPMTILRRIRSGELKTHMRSPYILIDTAMLRKLKLREPGRPPHRAATTRKP